MSDADPDEKAAPRWIDEPRNIVIVVLAQGMAFFGIGLAIWYGSERAPAAFLRWEALDLLVGALLAGALVGSMLAIALVFPRFLQWAAEEQQHLFPSGRPYRPVHVILVSLAAGVGEEALFRGGMQTLLGDYLPAWITIAAASLLFVVVHLGSLGASALIFIYSLAFGAAYHLTGSLLGVMLAHALFDIWALVTVQRELLRRGILKT